VYTVIFYKNKRNESPVADYIKELREKNDKSSRIKLYKITNYIDKLCEHGTKVGYPVIKNIGNNLWELRPIRDRILFFYYKDNTFVLLHYFMKKTNKTPKKEIKEAYNRMKEFLEREEKL